MPFALPSLQSSAETLSVEILAAKRSGLARGNPAWFSRFTCPWVALGHSTPGCPGAW